MSDVDLRDLARETFKENLQTGIDCWNGQSQEYFYIAPSRKKYPHQWLWDSSFHAVVSSKLNPSWAEKELRTLISAVDKQGFLPSITRWKGGRLREAIAWPLFDGKYSRLTQPPVVALALEEVFKKTKNLRFVESVLEDVARYYDWLGRERDPDGDQLISIIHPWEGADDSPAFDKPLLGKSQGRPSPVEVYASFYRLLIDYSMKGWNLKKIMASGLFNVENVMFNCIYAQGMRSLSRLARSCKKEVIATKYDKKADAVEKAILQRMFDPERGLFFDIVHKGETYEHNLTVTISSIFPIILDTIPKEIIERLVKNHLTNPVEFWLPYPIPFVSKEEESFNPSENVLLWRGPVWINTNWLIWRGLVKHGYREVAKELARRTKELVIKSGLREFYNPFTAKGEGQKNYSWSALVVDMVDN